MLSGHCDPNSTPWRTRTRACIVCGFCAENDTHVHLQHLMLGHKEQCYKQCFKINKIFSGYFGQENSFLDNENINFQGDLTDTPAETKPLVISTFLLRTPGDHQGTLSCSAAVVLFSKLNYRFFGYFDTEMMFLDCAKSKFGVT